MRFLLSTLLIGFSLTATAAEPGRYQAVVLPEAGRSGQNASLSSRVFILDTQEGHLWTWGENEAVHESNGRLKFGAVLMYQGQVRPGKKIGEIIERNFDP